MNIAEHGGRRTGQGHPTEAKQEKLLAKRLLSSHRVQEKLEEITDAEWESIFDQVKGMAMNGNMWAVRFLTEHTKGKAATMAPAVEDTQIHLHVEGIPRPHLMQKGSAEWRAFYDSLCSKCKAKLIGMGRENE
jgi:hypothetical protein